jgi:hypothetical protein
VTTTEQAYQVIETGRLEPAMAGARDEMQLITWEGEELSNGRSPPVSTLDNHTLHYRINSRAVMNEGGRQDPATVEATRAHLDAHYLEYYGIPPEQDALRLPRQRFLLGQGPEPMPMGPPGAPPGAPPGPPDAESPTPMDAMPPGPQGAPVADLPMPDNPLTGQAFNPVDGGGLVPAA